MKSYTSASIPNSNQTLSDQLNAKRPNGRQNVITCACHLWEGLDTPTSLGLWICAKYNDLQSVITHEINPSWYMDWDHLSYARDHQAVKFLAKLETTFEGLDPVEAAYSSFTSCEQQNLVENEFWRAVDTCKASLTPYMGNLLYGCRDILHRVLGEFDVSEWMDLCRLGPGLVAFGPKSSVDYIKLNQQLGVTTQLAGMATSLINEFEGWRDGLSYSGNSEVVIESHRGGKYTQVPKNAKTNRNIETQPLINVFLQLGLGQVMKRRLYKEGLDLSDQTLNQRLAQLGSLTGELATLDLSNASDTVSRGTIMALLPPTWYFALNMLRTSHILINGEWLELRRFSSMGNGFTFELQTAVFYAICRYICGPKATVSVFGDDIIVPAHKALACSHALKCFGFTVNSRKSFSEGVFRESCGKDYFNGHLVRPYFQKEIPENVPEIIRMANGLARSACRLSGNFHYTACFRRAVAFCHALIPKSVSSMLAIGWPEDDSYLCAR